MFNVLFKSGGGSAMESVIPALLQGLESDRNYAQVCVRCVWWCGVCGVVGFLAWCYLCGPSSWAAWIPSSSRVYSSLCQ